MPSTSFGTANTARMFLVVSALSAASPTAIAVPKTPEPQVRLPSVSTSRSLISSIKSQSITTATNSNVYEEISRPTTLQEKLIGELRELSLLKADWDGEGAAAPSVQSIKEAVSFVRMLNGITLPEPMLLASGQTALYWNEGNLYADIEFLGDGRIAYFIKNHGDKHKGVLAFDSQKMPAVFQTLLQA